LGCLPDLKEKYFIQDGSGEPAKPPSTRFAQKEPWKNLAVLGDRLPGCDYCIQLIDWQGILASYSVSEMMDYSTSI